MAHIDRNVTLYGTFSTGADNRNRMGVGTISQIFLSKKKDDRENG